MKTYIVAAMALAGAAIAEPQIKVCVDANFGDCGLVFATLGQYTIGSPIANQISSGNTLGHDCVWYQHLRNGIISSVHGQLGFEKKLVEKTAELHYLREQISDTAVCRLASRLNGDKTCTIEHATHIGPETMMGSANYHARIRFLDGSPSWLIRVPRVTSYIGCPLALIDYFVRSEYATLKFLQTTNVPAPRVFAYGVTGYDHGVGVSFLLVEELPGKAWNAHTATPTQKAKVWKHLAEIMAEIEKYPFNQAGSLVLHANNFRLSAVASDRFLVLDPRGPFLNSRAYYTAFVNQYLELIADQQLYPGYSVNAYLVYRFLKDSIPQLAPPEDLNAPEQFFLKHVDDKGDHLLVDEEFNITGIIDWQMARVVPRGEAFGPSLITADMSKLRRGQVSLTPDDIILSNAMREQGMSERNCWLAANDEKIRRFFWGLAVKPEWSEALPLAQAILQVFGVAVPWEGWKRMALERYKGDQWLQKLLTQTTN